MDTQNIISIARQTFPKNMPHISINAHSAQETITYTYNRALYPFRFLLLAIIEVVAFYLIYKNIHKMDVTIDTSSLYGGMAVCAGVLYFTALKYFFNSLNLLKPRQLIIDFKQNKIISNNKQIPIPSVAEVRPQQRKIKVTNITRNSDGDRKSSTYTNEYYGTLIKSNDKGFSTIAFQIVTSNRKNWDVFAKYLGHVLGMASDVDSKYHPAIETYHTNEPLIAIGFTARKTQ